MSCTSLSLSLSLSAKTLYRPTPLQRATPAFRFEGNEYRNKYFRHVSKGGWPFSTSAHGWPISDCTSEGLKATLCLLHSKTIKSSLKDGSVKGISDDRLYDAVNVLLTYQNEDGGTFRTSR